MTKEERKKLDAEIEKLLKKQKEMLGREICEFELEAANGKSVKLKIYESNEKSDGKNFKCYFLMPSSSINIRSIDWIYGCPIPSEKRLNGGGRILIYSD